MELAQDIRRYLSGEAIVGRPPSMAYQLRVFARRHRALFAALCATILIVLTAGLMVPAPACNFRAEQAREETARERDRALAAEQVAENRRAEAEAVTTFLSDTLAAVDPSEAQGREVTVREMLDEASETIDEAFNGPAAGGGNAPDHDWEHLQHPGRICHGRATSRGSTGDKGPGAGRKALRHTERNVQSRRSLYCPKPAQ